MNKQNSVIQTNKQWWEKMVRENCGFTQPWLNLNPVVVQKFAKGQLKTIPAPLNEMYPANILNNIKGKDVLCLAAGGGQQSAVFGLLGANVTVVDIADGQLAGDKKQQIITDIRLPLSKQISAIFLSLTMNLLILYTKRLRWAIYLT